MVLPLKKNILNDIIKEISVSAALRPKNRGPASRECIQMVAVWKCGMTKHKSLSISAPMTHQHKASRVQLGDRCVISSL